MVGGNSNYWENANDKELVEKGIEFALEDTGISRIELGNYCKWYGWDKRYKIEIVAVTTFWNKINCAGICKFKEKVYHFFFTEKYGKIIAVEIHY